MLLLDQDISDVVENTVRNTARNTVGNRVRNTVQNAVQSTVENRAQGAVVNPEPSSSSQEEPLRMFSQRMVQNVPFRIKSLPNREGKKIHLSRGVVCQSRSSYSLFSVKIFFYTHTPNAFCRNIPGIIRHNHRFETSIHPLQHNGNLWLHQFLQRVLELPSILLCLQRSADAEAGLEPECYVSKGVNQSI